MGDQALDFVRRNLPNYCIGGAINHLYDDPVDLFVDGELQPFVEEEALYKELRELIVPQNAAGYIKYRHDNMS